MNDKESHDLEEIIKKQKARIEELERDREILTKEIDRLSEYGQNLERLLTCRIFEFDCIENYTFFNLL